VGIQRCTAIEAIEARDALVAAGLIIVARDSEGATHVSEWKTRLQAKREGPTACVAPEIRSQKAVAARRVKREERKACEAEPLARNNPSVSKQQHLCLTLAIPKISPSNIGAYGFSEVCTGLIVSGRVPALCCLISRLYKETTGWPGQGQKVPTRLGSLQSARGAGPKGCVTRRFSVAGD
jgi:hypothetical protein